MRGVEVEGVDHVGIAQWFEKHQLVLARPIRAARKDCVLGRALAHGRGQFCLNPIPAVAIRHFGLVEDLKEDELRIPTCIMVGEGFPEIRELGNEPVLFQPGFEIALRVQIEDDGKPLVEDHLHRGIEVREIFGREVVGMIGGEHGLRIHAQANVIESERLDERDVGCAGPGLKMLLGVSLAVVDLREPRTQVDPPLEMRPPRLSYCAEWPWVLRLDLCEEQQKDS